MRDTDWAKPGPGLRVSTSLPGAPSVPRLPAREVMELAHRNTALLTPRTDETPKLDFLNPPVNQAIAPKPQNVRALLQNFL